MLTDAIDAQSERGVDEIDRRFVELDSDLLDRAEAELQAFGSEEVRSFLDSVWEAFSDALSLVGAPDASEEDLLHARSELRRVNTDLANLIGRELRDALP